ncbi:MAG: ATP-dependent DNA helicase RecG [Spirochaetaceae bacterium]|nr:ATP-dependent DNA helicase RecG [Spirochaetaceae bacterium]
MFLKEIAAPVASLSGVGPAGAKLFAALGIYSVGDLLSHWPRDWEDRSRHIPLSWHGRGKVNTIAKVTAHSWFGYGRMKTLKILIRDETAEAELICFNRPFLEKTLPVGGVIRVNGSFAVKYGSLQSSAFDAELLSREGELPAGEVPSGETAAAGSVLPVYPLTAGLTQTAVRKAMSRALREYGKGIEDELPLSVISGRHLMTKKQAVLGIHRPSSTEEALLARNTLIYEELFHFQLSIARRSLSRRGKLPGSELPETEDSPQEPSQAEGTSSVPDGMDEPLRNLSPRQKQLLERLPFSLTPDQARSLLEINREIDRGYESGTNSSVPACGDRAAVTATAAVQMSRLLQGDVGSGKTLVSFLACLRVADWGGQSAVLAPTELLARQHAENAAKLLEPVGVSLAFLTGNVKAEGRSSLLSALKEGKIDIVIGTHALFSRQVVYRDLKLAVIDEQHRFGVLQRTAIMEKGGAVPPHLLMMSATPIPRTLALTVFGDLDISTIRTMPQGRLPIITHLARQGNERKVYDYVRRELEKGRQAYFVYPLIDTADPDSAIYAANLKSAEEMHRRLSTEIYPGYRTALIHSRIDENEQREIMEGFRNGDIRILIATSVVEVGVDVPNATCMVIEHADRFGLSALHQLRGRVGRGTEQSYCFLVYGNRLTEEGKARMKILHEHTDGFLIAEEDLKLRGPGEVRGTRSAGIQQSGYLTLSIADPVRNSRILDQARGDAFDLVRRDPQLLSGDAAPIRELWKRAPPFRDVLQ